MRLTFIPATGFILALAACAPHVYAPGPGANPAAFNMVSARCRIFARSGDTGVEAYGRPGFVAGAVLGNAIGNAVREDANYDDCMQAAGWVPAASGAPVVAAPVAYGTANAAVAYPTPPASAAYAAPGVAGDPPHVGVIYQMGVGGAVVTSVVPGSGAYAAGIMAGDVITAIAGTPIRTSETIHEVMRGMPQAKQVTLDVIHNGVAETLFVSL